MDRAHDHSFPFARKNWIIFAIGIAVILLGYVLLSIPPADGFLSLTLAPILLVAGYCILIPMTILAKAGAGKSSGSKEK
jgi:hypothetical protein